MNKEDGYLLIESILSISIILIISTLICSLIIYCTKFNSSVEDKVELQQQASEISGHIEDLIGNSKEIMSIQQRKKSITSREENDFIDAISIKCRYRDMNDKDDISIKDKELSLKSNSKLFINTLYNSGTSEPGGYEIGAYIDKLYIKMLNESRCVNIKLELSKNEQNYETEFRVYIR